MSGPSPAQVVSQLNRVLDLAPNKEPVIIFFIGAGGSGKSTLATELRARLPNDNFEVAKFDDAPKLGMDRWDEHLKAYPDQEACLRAYVTRWVDLIAKQYCDKKLVVCDVNTTPDILRQVMADRPELKATILLVQPSQEVRVTRLANDCSREHMPIDALRAQFDPGFADFLAARSDELGITRVLNEQSEKSAGQVAAAAIKLLRDAAKG